MYNLQTKDFDNAVRYIKCSAMSHRQCLAEGSELDKQDMSPARINKVRSVYPSIQESASPLQHLIDTATQKFKNDRRSVLNA